MAQNTTVAIPSRTWTQLTNADATSVTFFNEGKATVSIKGTADANAPTTLAASISYEPGQGELNVDLGDLWPGISAVRVWGYAGTPTEVMVSHA